MNRAHFLVACLCLVGLCCDRSSKSRQRGNSTPSGEEPRMRLPFSITAVHPGQKPLDSAPWHADGGDWTFLDCATDGSDPVRFKVGIRDTKPQGGGGEAALGVEDRQQGARFVDLLAKTFGQPAPPPARPEPLAAFAFPTSAPDERDPLLKAPDDAAKSAQPWIRMEWLPKIDGFSAVLCFRCNLAGNRGELIEKDDDYRGSLLAIFAVALRDGVRTLRTPQTDGNLTDGGPRVVNLRPLSVDSPASSQAVFAPGGRFLLLSQGSVLYAIRPDEPAQRREVARVEGTIARFVCRDAEATRVFVEESAVQRPAGVPGAGAAGAAGGTRLWWVDASGGQKRQIVGPWDMADGFADDQPASPDGRYIMAYGTRGAPGSAQTTRVGCIFDSASGKSAAVHPPGVTWSHAGWTGVGNGLRAVVTAAPQWGQATDAAVYLADPATGQCVQATADQRPPAAEGLSPDGKLRVEVRPPAALAFTELASGKQRIFTFHEDDRRFVGEDCVRWVSPRYVQFRARQTSFIDAVTLKMNYPAGQRDLDGELIFSPDFKWVLVKGGDGLRLGQVSVPRP